MAVKDGLPSTDFSRMNREWVKAVAGGGSGGGGGLPEITEADEGKVLTVENGEAAWGAGGGGGGNANILFLTEDNETGELSETYATIESALKAGTIVIIKYIIETGCIFAPVLEASFNVDKYEVNALDYGATAFPISMTYSCASTTDFPAIE